MTAPTIDRASSCTEALKAMPDRLDVPGFTAEQLSRAICRATDYIAESSPRHAITKARTTNWPGLSKQVQGGLTHVISADNAAGYAELWSRGGNWYAVTGAGAGGRSLTKSDAWAIYEIPGIHKGMDIEQATARFLGAVFGPKLTKGTCGCSGAKT